MLLRFRGFSGFVVGSGSVGAPYERRKNFVERWPVFATGFDAAASRLDGFHYSRQGRCCVIRDDPNFTWRPLADLADALQLLQEHTIECVGSRDLDDVPAGGHAAEFVRRRKRD
jgi:hypothetical protein